MSEYPLSIELVEKIVLKLGMFAVIFGVTKPKLFETKMS